jgi:hypothetical protein
LAAFSACAPSAIGRERRDARRPRSSRAPRARAARDARIHPVVVEAGREETDAAVEAAVEVDAGAGVGVDAAGFVNRATGSSTSGKR